MFDTPTSGDACEGAVLSNTIPPNHEDKETSPNGRNATPRPKPRSRRFAESLDSGVGENIW